MAGGPFGAVFGAALGHSFDSGFLFNQHNSFTTHSKTIQTAFFSALFSAIGHVAKADGNVSQAEIIMAENVMQRMNLNADQKRAAIRLFNDGKRSNFPLDACLNQFRIACSGQRPLMRMFFEILLDAALIDGHIKEAERGVLVRCCIALGLSPGEFRTLEQRRYQGAPAPQQKSNTNPYRVLGLKSDASIKDIKRAYRKQMSQNHPDKLVSKGLPTEMIKIAEDKTHQILQAYEAIKKQRRFT